MEVDQAILEIKANEKIFLIFALIINAELSNTYIINNIFYD